MSTSDEAHSAKYGLQCAAAAAVFCVVKKHRTAMASLYPELLELNQQDLKTGAERGEEESDFQRRLFHMWNISLEWHRLQLFGKCPEENYIQNIVMS